MASLQSQLTDIIGRLRRGLNITGPSALSVGQQLALDVVIANFDQDPFRQEPTTFTAQLTVAAGAAGNASFVALQAAPGTVVCVDAVFFQTTAAQGGFILGVDRNAPSPNPSYPIGGGLIAALNRPSPGNAAEGTSLDPQSFLSGANATGGLVLLKGQNFNALPTGPANVPVTTQLPEPVVLYGSPLGSAKTGDMLILFTGTAATQVIGGFWAREYTQLGIVRG